jgi:hypothetical protein
MVVRAAVSDAGMVKMPWASIAPGDSCVFSVGTWMAGVQPGISHRADFDDLPT